jgi:hypothetical protein
VSSNHPSSEQYPSVLSIAHHIFSLRLARILPLGFYLNKIPLHFLLRFKFKVILRLTVCQFPFTAAKFKSRVFLSGFALSSIPNICIFMILCCFWFLTGVRCWCGGPPFSRRYTVEMWVPAANLQVSIRHCGHKK